MWSGCRARWQQLLELRIGGFKLPVFLAFVTAMLVATADSLSDWMVTISLYGMVEGGAAHDNAAAKIWLWAGVGIQTSSGWLAGCMLAVPLQRLVLGRCRCCRHRRRFGLVVSVLFATIVAVPVGIAGLAPLFFTAGAVLQHHKGGPAALRRHFLPLQMCTVRFHIIRNARI